ncbi:MAG TPA: VOC family protein [Patescibacteria group bacterium]|nr:VOC family protein [Patescibacteria group bacterium]
MQKITPNLWFDGNAREAVDFYISVFPDGKVINTSYYPNEGLAEFQKDMAGKELTIDFELGGQRFTAINAGPEFKFNESVSFLIACKDQEEIDYYWERLSKSPENEQCGWCKDQFGLSWQVVPESMEELMNKPEAFQKMMQMKKIVIADFDKTLEDK